MEKPDKNQTISETHGYWGAFKAGVGGGVNPSPREEGKGMRPVQRAKPPQPRGLVGI